VWTSRTAGTAAAVAGGVVSLILLLVAGKSTPLLLLIMFFGWVLLPFALLILGIRTARSSEPMRSALSFMSIVLSLVSIVVYLYFTLHPPATTPARVWLLTPGSSLVVIVAVYAYGRFRGGAD
jgi:hypothetical protein